MQVDMKIEGLKEIEQALATLKIGTSKGVARRAMKKELKPVMDMANALWPGSSDEIFKVTSKVSGSQPCWRTGRGNRHAACSFDRMGYRAAHAEKRAIYGISFTSTNADTSLGRA